ncbi:MAG: hypothetical protein CMM50_08525 [Rhodospirillaceae bacterium]|nr:hypothetical protein [Rhodospirillaceae bacterium]
MDCGIIAALGAPACRRVRVAVAVTLALTAVVSLSGCVDPAAVRAMASPDDPFARALHRNYLDIADRQAEDGSAFAASFFAYKAREAAKGEFVLPERLDDWRLGGDAAATLSLARLRLVSALAEKARRTAPEAAARAQVLFDCWVAAEEVQEDPQDCGGRFRQALNEVEAADPTN